MLKIMNETAVLYYQFVFENIFFVKKYILNSLLPTDLSVYRTFVLFDFSLVRASKSILKSSKNIVLLIFNLKNMIFQ